MSKRNERTRPSNSSFDPEEESTGPYYDDGLDDRVDEEGSSSSSSSSSSSAGGFDPDLIDVTFSNGSTIKRDYPTSTSENDYGAPQWQAKPPRQYPYLYVQGKTLRVTARWTISGVPETKNLHVRADCDRGFTIGPVRANRDGNTISIIQKSADSAFDKNSTQYYKSFTIHWKMSDDGGKSWEDAGTSINDIYVSLKPPSGSLPPHLTVVHLACSNAGATTTEEAASKTWALFESLTVKESDNSSAPDFTVPIRYYRVGTDYNENPQTVEGLLRAQTGQCNSWQKILYDAWELNGVKSTMIQVTVSGSINNSFPVTWFLVNAWGYSNNPTIDPNTYLFYLNRPNGDMLPVPPSGYGDLTNGTGEPGQNSPTPSEKVFEFHQILRRSVSSLTTRPITKPSKYIYYDPSYGLTYESTDDFKSKSIAGFGATIRNEGALIRIYVQKPTAAFNVKFSSEA